MTDSLFKPTTRSFVPFWPFSTSDTAGARLGSSGSTSKRDEVWNSAVTEAERIVGYPTSFMSLRLLLSDEVSNIALQLRKLVGTKHPLLGTAKALLYDEKQSVQTRGLVVLLLSKTFGPPSTTNAPDQDIPASSSTSPSPISSMSMVSGIYASQRTIAELVEVVYTADLIHRGLLDLKDRTNFQVSVAKDIEFANRMAVLAGDFLLANACTGLARLGSTRVVQLIANAISNLMEARFIHDGSEKGDKQKVENVDLTLENWEKKTYLGVASLLAKACEAAMEVVGHSEEVQIHAREFGQNLAFAQQIKSEIDQFSDDDQRDSFKLLSAPVVLHVRQQRESSSFIEEASLLPVVTSTADDRTAMFEAVRSGPGIELAKELGHHHRREALAKLEHLPDTESKAALTNIVNSIACVG